MTLFRLKSAPLVLIEDDSDKNIMPILSELLQDERSHIVIFCYENPINLWKNVFRPHSNVSFYREFNIDTCKEYTSVKCSLIVDSINQMALCLGWSECLKHIKQLVSNDNVSRLVLILHKDCLAHNSRLQSNLNHLVNAIISYDQTNSNKVKIRLKKGTRVLKSEEIISFDTTGSLLLKPISKETKETEPDKPLPGNLTTFKIEVDQGEKIQKYNLKLPYMSKIHEGESKVYYEPDAVDDWDEEDPDEDLDI